MNRVTAAIALALALAPVAAASALPPPQHRAVTCTKRHVVDAFDLRAYLVCLNQR